MDVKKDLSDIYINRRKFLSAGLASAASVMLPLDAVAAVGNYFADDRSLSFVNTFTDEYIEVTYCSGGYYNFSALDKINYLFRDHYNEAITPIHTKLLDLLYFSRKLLRSTQPYRLISGYRSPITNASLRRRNRKVARNSLHMYGMAADVRLPGTSLRTLRKTAKSLNAGGIGYYPRSRFVHLDVGEIRYWRR